MNTKQQHEFNFWKNLVKQMGHRAFLGQREVDYIANSKPYGVKLDLSGIGLEVGTGCYSQLEWCEADKVISVDPLNSEFRKLLPKYNEFVDTENYDGEDLNLFSDNLFDWVVCWNVIDHTPNPKKMADELFRVLKPNGKLYFEVNFDDQLAPPHYDLWNEDKVREYFGNRKLVYSNIIKREGQRCYYAIYEKT